MPAVGHFSTGEGEFAGFAFSLPVLDVWYGRWVTDDSTMTEHRKQASHVC